MKFKALATLVALMFLLTGSVMAEQWIHVKVDEGHGDGEQVTLNLPISLLKAAAAMIPDDFEADARVEIDELDMDWNDLMNLWREVRDAPEATFVTVQSKDETVKVRKEGEFLVAKTTDRGARGSEVDMKLPLAVIDALLSGPEGSFNFEAALTALADFGPGNLVSVRDGDQTVRVWIDNQNEAE